MPKQGCQIWDDMRSPRVNLSLCNIYLVSHAEKYRHVLAHRGGHNSVTNELAELLHCMYSLLRQALDKMSVLLDTNDKALHQEFRRTGPLQSANECGEVCATGFCADNNISEIYDKLPEQLKKVKKMKRSYNQI